MGLSATSELALDLGLPTSSSSPTAARAVAGILRQAAASGNGRTAARLEEYLRGLEGERRKIEGFRRELPLCMLVLNDVIESLRDELRRAGAPGRPVLEEFMPLARKSDEEDGGVKQDRNDRDKVNWMSSVQLWSDNSSTNTSSTASITIATANNGGSSASSRKNTHERSIEDDRRTQEDENLLGGSRYRNGGGTFLALKDLPAYQGNRPRKEKVGTEVVPLPDLSLLSPATKASRAAASPMAEDRWSGWSTTGGPRARAEGSLYTQPSASQQPPRKARRCWSPELHRRFVDALQQLGGAQVATPKQIRELMMVDGLTNDEVKSHLQKYRLHNRKVPGAPNPANQQGAVMFGGLWLPPATTAKDDRLGESHSGSPQGPLQLTAAAKRVRDSCEEEEEEEEEGRAESYTWKGHLQSGEETN